MLPVAILAGGLSTRLRPITNNLPKALVRVNGEPFIAHQLRLLQRKGIAQVVLCVGHLGGMIREFVGTGERFGLHVDYSFDGPSLRGTAGAVKHALHILGENFFVLYGDSYLPCDYTAIERAFVESRRQALMTIFKNNGRWDQSNVQFTDGRILAYDKSRPTSAMRHIDYGLGVFSSSAFAAVPDQSYDLAALYADLLRADQLAAFEVRERFYEVGSFEGVRELSEFLAHS
jgi:MurNAc alpha-1-phosphate uridylyltransferase